MTDINNAEATAVEYAKMLIGMTTGTDKEVAIELFNRLTMPMGEVLAKVKGATHKAKAARIGVSRQTYYSWKNNENRPTPKQARKIAMLTRIPADRIMGRKR